MSGLPQRRLFFALLPGAAARAALQALARPYRAARVRSVPAADLHLTLAFIGQVPDAALPRLQEAAGAIRAAPCGVVLDRLERWRGGLLCATGAVTPALLALHAQLLRAVRGAGLAVDARPLRAHVTLARGLPRVAGAAEEAMRPVRLQARSFCLMESARHADGGRYTALARWRLDSGRDAAKQHGRGAAGA
jgi:2'-5' RNA ligase